MEAVSSSMQVVEPFLPVQPQSMASSKAIIWSSDHSDPTCPEN